METLEIVLPRNTLVSLEKEAERENFRTRSEYVTWILRHRDLLVENLPEGEDPDPALLADILDRHRKQLLSIEKELSDIRDEKTFEP